MGVAKDLETRKHLMMACNMCNPINKSRKGVMIVPRHHLLLYCMDASLFPLCGTFIPMSFKIYVFTLVSLFFHCANPPFYFSTVEPNLSMKDGMHTCKNRKALPTNKRVP